MAILPPFVDPLSYNGGAIIGNDRIAQFSAEHKRLAD
jgi:hypothetical protein